MRRSIFARVKFLSRLFTALNLLPSIATLTSPNRPTARQRRMNRAHTLRIAPPLSLRKSAIVLVVRNKPARQPHHLDVASSLALEPPARLNPIEVAVDIKLQQDRWMVRGPASYLGSNPVKSQLRQIKLINKDIDHLDR